MRMNNDEGIFEFSPRNFVNPRVPRTINIIILGIIVSLEPHYIDAGRPAVGHGRRLQTTVRVRYRRRMSAPRGQVFTILSITTILYYK